MPKLADIFGYARRGPFVHNDVVVPLYGGAKLSKETRSLRSDDPFGGRGLAADSTAGNGTVPGDERHQVQRVLNLLALTFEKVTKGLDQERQRSQNLSEKLEMSFSKYERCLEELSQKENDRKILANQLLHALSERDAITARADLPSPENIKKNEERDHRIAVLERELEDERAARAREICELRARNGGVTDELTELKGLLVSANEKLVLFEKERHSARRSLEGIQAQFSAANTQLVFNQNALKTVQDQFEELKSRHAEVCFEREELADALGSLTELHQSERQISEDQIKERNSRAADAMAQLADTRQRLIDRTLEARSVLCKMAGLRIALSKAERRLAEIEGVQGMRSLAAHDVEQGRNALSTFLKSLNEKSLELKQSGAQEAWKLQSQREEEARGIHLGGARLSRGGQSSKFVDDDSNESMIAGILESARDNRRGSELKSAVVTRLERPTENHDPSVLRKF